MGIQDWGRLFHPGHQPFPTENGKGKRVAAYNRNPECTAPGFGAPPERRLAASLYSYDSLGRLETQYKWIGASENPSDRIQKIAYAYDGLGRLLSKRIFSTGSGNQVVNAQYFEYDGDGRVQGVLDKDSNTLVAYAYNDLDQLPALVEYTFYLRLHGRADSLMGAWMP